MAKYVYGIAVLFFSSWAVLLGGIASLQSSCNEAPDSIQQWLQANQLPNLAAFISRLDSFNDAYYLQPPTCGRVLSFQWFILFWALVVGFLATACASPTAAKRLETATIGNLAALIVVYMLYCHKWNSFLWYGIDKMPEELEQRVQTTVAGYILMVISFFFFVFGISGLGNQSTEEHTTATIQAPRAPAPAQEGGDKV